MRVFTAVVVKCPDTGLYVGYVPNFPGAHSQGETLDELYQNLHQVLAMLLEDGEPQLETGFHQRDLHPLRDAAEPDRCAPHEKRAEFRA